jgi:hypothetical protein
VLLNHRGEMTTAHTRDDFQTNLALTLFGAIINKRLTYVALTGPELPQTC